MLEYQIVKSSKKGLILSIISKIIVNMIVLFMTTKIFQNIYVENMFYLFILSIFLVLFNIILKPFLCILMLPINIITLGITYPFVNVLVLKFISFIMGNHFVLTGWFSAFFISIFISIMTFIIDRVVGREIRRV